MQGYSNLNSIRLMGQHNSRRGLRARDDDESSYSSQSSDNEAPYEYEHLLHPNLLIDGRFPHGTNRKVMPRRKYKPDTTDLKKSDFLLLTKQECGITQLQRTPNHFQNNVCSMVTKREAGTCTYSHFSNAYKSKIYNRYLPNESVLLDTCPGKVFCGVLSRDGSRLITASQDRQIKIYDSSKPNYKLMRTLLAPDIGWSILDVDVSPDNQHFVYSTWSSALYLSRINQGDEEEFEEPEPLYLANTGRRFCVFSVAFSADSSEIVGGANDGRLYIYSREIQARISKVQAHEYDVNAVTFADKSSNIVYSGGDDGVVRVWDRRTSNNEVYLKPVGLFAGHIDGITYIDSREDGRHLISNSKDQTIKLWDLRVFSHENTAKMSLKEVQEQTWDYRWQEVPKKLFCPKQPKLIGDTSVLTLRGHVVVQTLVRCKFSPVETTGQRYIYTGCGLGRVLIYDALTGRMKKDLKGHASCVRDVAWHPTRSEIISSAWDGGVRLWTCNRSKVNLDKNCEKELVEKINVKEKGPVRRSVRLMNRQHKGSRGKLSRLDTT